MVARFAGGRRARRDEGAWPQRPVTEKQRRQTPASKPPAGLPSFDPAAALLVGRRSTRDILPPRALPPGQISGNAPVPHLLTRSKQVFAPVVGRPCGGAESQPQVTTNGKQKENPMAHYLIEAAFTAEA